MREEKRTLTAMIDKSMQSNRISSLKDYKKTIIAATVAGGLFILGAYAIDNGYFDRVLNEMFNQEPQKIDQPRIPQSIARKLYNI